MSRCGSGLLHVSTRVRKLFDYVSGRPASHKARKDACLMSLLLYEKTNRTLLDFRLRLVVHHLLFRSE